MKNFHKKSQESPNHLEMSRLVPRPTNSVAREVFITRLPENLQLNLNLGSKEQLFTAVKEFLSEFNQTPLINLLNGSLLPVGV